MATTPHDEIKPKITPLWRFVNPEPEFFRNKSRFFRESGQQVSFSRTVPAWWNGSFSTVPGSFAAPASNRTRSPRLDGALQIDAAQRRRLVQRRTVRAGGHHPDDLLLLIEHQTATARCATAVELHTDRLTGLQALPERVAPDEIPFRCQIEPVAQPGVERRPLRLQFVPVERVAHLQTQRIPRAQSGGHHRFGRKQQIPELVGVLLVEEEFVPELS
ncbi:MAG: hypothetical protein L6W00_13235 [Lentisphaeria bacterium]|nr:MAG: hypothetical protein L6W00_13235 [Lentisphaeria bacterium]